MSSKHPLYGVNNFIDIFLILALRHNGIVPAAFIVLFCLWRTVRHFKRERFRLFVAALIGVVSFAIYKGPIFALLHVAPNTASTYTTMLCAVGSCVNKNLPLSDDTTQTLETIMPIEDWRDFYSRFEGHDQYLWGRGEDARFDTAHITAQLAFSMYFDALFKYPDVVIKDRLDGMDILWNIRQPDDSFNSKTHDVICNMEKTAELFAVENLTQSSWGDNYNKSSIAELNRKAVNTQPGQVADMLLWRSGSYIVLLLTLLLFWAANHMKYIWCASLPLVGNIAGSLLVVYHQSFRYVYFIQVLTIALAFITICLRNEGTQNRSVKGEMEP